MKIAVFAVEKALLQNNKQQVVIVFLYNYRQKGHLIQELTIKKYFEMFRASQIASEESKFLYKITLVFFISSNCYLNFFIIALPALGLLTLNDNEPELMSVTSNKIKHGNKKSEGYGLVKQLTPRRPKYPIAIVFVLMAKLFEAFAANGIRSKYLCI